MKTLHLWAVFAMVTLGCGLDPNRPVDAVGRYKSLGISAGSYDRELRLELRDGGHATYQDTTQATDGTWSIVVQVQGRWSGLDSLNSAGFLDVESFTFSADGIALTESIQTGLDGEYRCASFDGNPAIRSTRFCLREQLRLGMSFRGDERTLEVTNFAGEQVQPSPSYPIQKE